MNRIFEPKAPIKVSDLMELNNLDELLQSTFTMTTIQTEQRKEDGSFVAVSYTLHVPYLTQLLLLF